MSRQVSAATAQSRHKHVPQRTCVSCGRVSAKRELIRLVRTPGGAEVDPTGKRAGRGAYLCSDPECWTRAIKKGRLESALRTKLSPDTREALLAYGAERQEAQAP